MDFKNYKSIKDLTKLTNQQLEKLGEEIRSLIYQQVINDEGHLGSNMAIVDLTLSLLRRFQKKKVRYLFDTGYQAYAFKMLTGRKNFLQEIHKQEGYNIFQEIEEGDPYSGGHTSISAAWASGYNTLDDDYLNIEIIGDGSIATSIGLGGMLNFAKNDKKKNLFILNDNKQGIGINEFNYLNWEQIAKGMNYEYFEVMDGHDYKELEKAWDFFDKATKNVFIKVNTIKAYGLKIPNPDEALHYITQPSKINDNKVHSINYLVNEILKDELKNKNTMIYIPGMTYVFGLKKLKEKYPNQIIDAGISEEISIVEAAAAANAGKNVYCIILSSFSQRIYDQIIHDVMRNNINIKIVIGNVGVTPLGDSHHGIYDLNMYNGFENIYIYQPSTSGELKAIINNKYKNPIIIRLENQLVNNKNENQFKNWRKLTNNNSKDIIISYGDSAYQLVNYINKNNLSIDVVKAVALNPIDNKLLENIFDNYKNVYTYEPVFWKNNMASTIRVHYKDKIIIDFSFYKPLIGKWDLESIYKENNMDLKYIIKYINKN